MNKKEKIVDAAVRIFIEKGAAFTKLNEVAKRAKVPAPLIHYYFKDLEDLHYEIILIAYESLKTYALRGIKKANHDPLEVLKEYLKGQMQWPFEKPELMSLWIYFYYMASWSKKFEELNTQIRNTGRDRIALMIYSGVEKGVFKIREDDNVKDVAQEIQCAITGQIIMAASEAKTKSVDFYISQVTNAALKRLGF